MNRRLIDGPSLSLLWCFVGLIAFQAPAVTLGAESLSRSELVGRANAEFDLYASQVAALEMNTAPSVSQNIVVPVDGESLVLSLRPHSVRSKHYEVRYQRADGTYDTVEPGPVRTVRGAIDGINGSSVAGSVTENGLVVMVKFPDGARLWIEPLAGRVAEAAAGDHVIYRDEDIVPSGRSCGAVIEEGPIVDGPTPMMVGCEGATCVAELACDSDVEYFNRWGNSVEVRINNVINAMNEQYESEVGITHVISHIIVRPTEPDPYFGPGGGDLLSQMTSHWVNNQQSVVRDVAQLFTGRSLAGSAIGVAWRGTVCNNGAFGAYSIVESDCCGGLGAATDLSAHEIGHNWNAEHCGPTAGCGSHGGCLLCSLHTMRCAITGANRFHETCTQPTIIAFRNSRSCLSDLAPTTTFPFSDEFPGPDINGALWLSEGATVDDVGANEPSAPFSLHLNSDDKATTGFMDTSALEHVGVEFWWQRSGSLGPGGSPELGEDLITEYLSDDGSFIELARAPGDPGNGGDNEPYARSCAVLPADGIHESTQIRFRILDAEFGDHFFIDDVRVVEGSEFLAITVQPQLDLACLGGTGEFSVTASGEGPFSYQWKHNGTNISGATDDTLVISPVGPGDFGAYSVEVSGGCGTIESNEAQLIESTPIVITQHPQDTTVSLGGTLFLSMSATGGAEFQWFFNDDPIPAATSAFLFISNMQCANQGCYNVVATNGCGQEVSNAAVVTVSTCPPFDCSVDTTPPEIVHAAGLPGETRPFSGYIDPRIESSNGADLDRGTTQVTLRFSETVDNVGGGGLTADAFTVSETGAETPPGIVSVDATNMPEVVITLDRPITLSEYTTIQATVQDMADIPNVIVDAGNQGDVDESDRVDIAFLPADVDQDGEVGPFDLLAFRQIVNGQLNPEQGTNADYVDSDRDGAVAPFDLLTFRQMVNGIAPATRSWSGETLNDPRP